MQGKENVFSSKEIQEQFNWLFKVADSDLCRESKIVNMEIAKLQKPLLLGTQNFLNNDFRKKIFAKKENIIMTTFTKLMKMNQEKNAE